MEAEYHFECLAIRINGVYVDGFSGTAILTDDGTNGGFFVSMIALPGQTITRKPHSAFADHKATDLILRAGKEDGPAKVLFDLIKAELESSQHVDQFWSDKLFEERADAA